MIEETKEKLVWREGRVGFFLFAYFIYKRQGILYYYFKGTGFRILARNDTTVYPQSIFW